MLLQVKYDKPTKLACLQSIYVSFPYRQDIVEIIREIPERFWDAKNKRWELPFNSLSYLRENLPKDEFNIEGEPVDDTKFGDKHIKEYDIPKSIKTQLYDYQKDTYNEGMTYNKYLYLLEPGLGKTVITITTVVKRYELGQIKRCLIIAGVNGLKYTWQQEFEKHSSYRAKILGNRQNKKGIWEVKGNKDKLEDLENLTDEDIFLVTNVETLRDKTIFEKLKKLCDKKEINCIVFDECHKCASVSSQQGKALLRLVKNIEYFYGLTGTIIMNKPLDTYVPLKCVGKEIANFTQFKSRYCIWGGFGGYEIVGYKNLPELQNKLYAVSKRLRKRDVLSLPPKVYVDEYVEMGAKQKKVYNDIQNIIMANLDKISAAIDPLAQLIRLRQATATTSIVSSSVNESAKFSRAKEIIDELVADNKSVLVFSNWSKVIDSFEEYLKKDYKVAKITGDVKYREKEIELFNSKDCNIMIGTIGALGTGYTLTKATTVIFLDEPWTNAAKEQAEDRCYRIGTSESVNIITIMVKNTIDEYVSKIVKKKGYLSDALVDSKYDLKNENVLRFLVTGEGEI